MADSTFMAKIVGIEDLFAGLNHMFGSRLMGLSIVPPGYRIDFSVLMIVYIVR